MLIHYINSHTIWILIATWANDFTTFSLFFAINKSWYNSLSVVAFNKTENKLLLHVAWETSLKTRRINLLIKSGWKLEWQKSLIFWKYGHVLDMLILNGECRMIYSIEANVIFKIGIGNSLRLLNRWYS